MKKTMLTLMMGMLLSGSAPAGDLKKEFADPPDSARMWTWWFWLGDKVDRASITADLEAMKAQGITKVAMARRMGTSRAHLDRLLDPRNDKVQLDTVQRAATAVGRRLRVELA